MTISIVNGYTCETGCEVARAKAGQDPHPTRRDPIEGDRGASTSSTSAFDSPAVMFGGSLSALSSTAIAPADRAQDPRAVATQAPGGRLDLFV